MTRRALLCALLLAGACLPAVEDDGGAAARPLPAPAGAPEGPPVAATIGPEGGTLASADARLTVAVPVGAVAGPTAFSVQEITNTAPGGVGAAYRLAPHGGALGAPVTLVFRVDAGSGSLDRLAVATQEGGGYWVRHRRVVRDRSAGTITATVEHFSDWAVQTASTDRDLRGTFTVDSTIGLPFTATGEALLDFAGEDAAGAYFLQSGTISAPASLPSGASTCAPDRPAHALPTNVVEIAAAAPPAFEWGVSGHWPLTCTWSGGSTTSDFISVAFDTYGINLLGCARSYVGTPVVSATAVQGTYVIDCGPEGRVTARWDFAACPAGAACTSTNPCRTAAMSCDTGAPVCTETGSVADGTSCGAGLTCVGGVCT